MFGQRFILMEGSAALNMKPLTKHEVNRNLEKALKEKRYGMMLIK